MSFPDPQRARPLLIGGDGGISTILEFAQQLRDSADARWMPLVLLESQAPFSFRPRPSTILVAGMPEGTIACAPMLDEMGIASRLATDAGYPGCFDGSVLDLAATWLGSLDASALGDIEMFVCGSASLLDSASALARRFGIPLQLRDAGAGSGT